MESRPNATADTRILEAQDSRISGILADLDAELVMVQELIDHSTRRVQALRKARDIILNSMAGPVSPGPSEAAAPEPTRAESRQPRPGSQVEMVIRTARTVLVRTGRPMTRTELLEAIQAEGFEVKAAHPAKRIGKILWSSKAFDHVGDGYWPKGIAIPSR